MANLKPAINSRGKRAQSVRGLFLGFILLMVAACTSPVYYTEDGGPVTQEAAIAPTEIPVEATSTPVPQAAPAQPADPALIAAIGIDPAQVSLNTQGLPLIWRANAVPATPYTLSEVGGSTGLPAHIQINFNNLDPAARQPGDPVIFLIPAHAYQELWNQASDLAVTATMGQILDKSYALPNPPPLRNLPALPNEVVQGGRQDFATQVSNIGSNASSASRNGFRFVGRFADESTPVTNEEMQYVYQGFTNDGEYLVAAFFPNVTNASLPATVDGVSAEDLAAFDAGQDAALAATAIRLANEETSAWTPDVALFDSIIASLNVPGVPQNALAGESWSLLTIGDAVATNGDNIVTFNANGTLNVIADCNVASGQYVATGGVTGSLAVTLGPTTLVACAEGSLSDAFLAALQDAQTYNARPGDAVLIIEGGAGSPRMTFAPLGAPDMEIPTAEPPVVILPTPEPAVPMGRIVGAQGANIRGGPGTNFPIIGFAPNGQEVVITGQSANGDWLVVSIPTLPSGVGWISAPLVATTNADDVPVVASPPTPVPTATPVAPTPTPTQVPPTPTPAARINFFANPTQINQGQCSSLFWDVENVQAVWVYPLGANFRDFPVTGQGSRQECPQSTTTYEMRVQLTNGQLELRQATIRVNAVNPLANTNWTVSTIFAGSVPTGDQTLTLQLAADGTFGGFGGCNPVQGTYTVEGSRINFILGGTGMAACDADSAAIQSAYQNALATAAFYDFLGFQLVFRDFSGMETMRLLASS